MKKLDITKDGLKRMQKMRDNGITTRDIGRIFGCSASFVSRHTSNPKRLKTEEEQIAMYAAYLERKVNRTKKKTTEEMQTPNVFLPKKVTRERKEKEDFDREVRVLREVPSDFKVPSRVVGW